MLDFTLVLGIGLVSGLTSVAALMGSLRLLKSRLETEIITNFEEYLTGFMQKIKENPQFVVEFVKPMLPVMLEELKKGFPAAEGQESGSGGLGELGLNFIPKKYRGLAQIALMFMGNGGLGGNKGQSSPGLPSGNANKSPFS